MTDKNNTLRKKEITQLSGNSLESHEVGMDKDTNGKKVSIKADIHAEEVESEVNNSNKLGLSNLPNSILNSKLKFKFSIKAKNIEDLEKLQNKISKSKVFQDLIENMAIGKIEEIEK